MEFAAGPPTKWTFRLVGGAEVTIWADSRGEEDGDLVFSNLVDAAEEEQAEIEVTGRTPKNPRRVVMTVARIPLDIVDDPWPPRPSES